MKNKILLSILALFLLVAMAVSLTACIFWEDNKTTSNNNDVTNPDGSIREPIDYTDTFLLVDWIFKKMSIFDVDYETAMLAAIRAYVEATGDKYAMFYTPEELDALFSENNGDLYGIGVQVIFNYVEHCMEVVLIMPDSPAQGQLQVGDKVTHITVDGKKIALSDVVATNKEKIKTLYPNFTDEEVNIAAGNETMDYAVANLKGPEGTKANFTVMRDGVSTDYSITRAKVKTVSVTCKKSIRDSSVGIISIKQFDMTTPIQFKECMDQLIFDGCDKFVFDVRNNPGGDLASLVAVMSTMLNKGDVILSTKDTSGNTQVTKADVVTYSQSSGYATCNVTKKDLGKYRGYEFVVLANENSASAAELFTSVLRDHNLATIVGTKTYGKGSVQSIYDLSAQGKGYYGGLKLTTKLYFPPSGVGYNGIGIEPHHNVELQGIAAETHFYKLTEDIDNQLQKAVSLLID